MSMNERERLLAILYAIPEAISLSEMADYLLNLRFGEKKDESEDKK